jgi:AcrR family transcriptional regulator
MVDYMRSSAPRVGRQRSDATRTAILEAALARLRESGYGALTVEGIAAAAGCGKQTIYRWWPSKAEVVLEALSELARDEVEVARTHDARSDLQRFLRRTMRALRGPNGAAPVLRGLMAEAQLDEEFRTALRSRFIDGRRRALIELLRSLPDPPDEELAPVLADAIYGSIWYRLLVGHAPLSDAFADQLVGIAIAIRPR